MDDSLWNRVCQLLQAKQPKESESPTGESPFWKQTVKSMWQEMFHEPCPDLNELTLQQHFDIGQFFQFFHNEPNKCNVMFHCQVNGKPVLCFFEYSKTYCMYLDETLTFHDENRSQCQVEKSPSEEKFN